MILIRLTHKKVKRMFISVIPKTPPEYKESSRND